MNWIFGVVTKYIEKRKENLHLMPIALRELWYFIFLAIRKYYPKDIPEKSNWTYDD